MKKILSILLCLVMALGLAVPAMAEGYTAGTYTASADGNNGPVTVEVDFDENAITAVRVTEHAETAGICETPIERIPAAIVENQSLAVDTIAGATNTSNAILAAVADCVKQAGGDPEALKGAVESAPAVELEDMTTDVVVVGAGIAGLTAALTAAQERHGDILARIIFRKIAVFEHLVIDPVDNIQPLLVGHRKPRRSDDLLQVVQQVGTRRQQLRIACGHCREFLGRVVRIVEH